MRNIFNPSDFSPASNNAFIHALRLALNAKGNLTILHTGATRENPHWDEFPHVRKTLVSWGILPADCGRSAVGGLGLTIRKVVSPQSDPVQGTLHYLEHHPQDLIILATHYYSGLARLLHKPVAGPIGFNAQALTLFLPELCRGFIDINNGQVHLRRILIPVDFNPPNEIAIFQAAVLARLLQAEEVTFTLLHVGPLHQFPPLVKLPEQAGWRWQREFRTGRVEQEILLAAEQTGADLIVMATAGQHGFLDALRGSTTERVVAGAKCPVLAVPAHQTETLPEISPIAEVVA